VDGGPFLGPGSPAHFTFDHPTLLGCPSNGEPAACDTQGRERPPQQWRARRVRHAGARTPAPAAASTPRGTRRGANARPRVAPTSMKCRARAKEWKPTTSLLRKPSSSASRLLSARSSSVVGNGECRKYTWVCVGVGGGAGEGQQEADRCRSAWGTGDREGRGAVSVQEPLEAEGNRVGSARRLPAAPGASPWSEPAAPWK
jgi:hypothetical protein